MAVATSPRLAARRNDLAAIHIAKAQLGLSDDEYRDLLSTVCPGIRSAADLDVSGRRRFLAHLQACLRGHGKAQPQRLIRKPLSEPQRLMWSLWMQLADAGLVRARSMAALAAYARRQTGVERLEWLNKHQEHLVIETLKKWLARAAEGAKT